MGQPLSAHDGIRMRADQGLDSPAAPPIALADGLAGTAVSSVVIYAGMAQVVGFLESVAERAGTGLFQVICLVLEGSSDVAVCA